MESFEERKIKRTCVIAAVVFVTLSLLFSFGRNAIERFNLQCLALTGEVKLRGETELRDERRQQEIRDQKDMFKQAVQIIKQPSKPAAKTTAKAAPKPVVTVRTKPPEDGFYATRSSGESTLPTITVDSKDKVVLNPQNWRGPEDLSFKARLTRLDDGFHVVVLVKDDVRWAKDPKVHHRNDCVEIYFDLRPKNTRGTGEYEAHSVRHALIVPYFGIKGIADTMIFHFKNDEPMPQGCWVKSSPTDTGYRVEAFFPFKMFNARIEDEFNFDIGVIDYDGEGNFSQMVWSGVPDNYKDPRWFGRMKPVK